MQNTSDRILSDGVRVCNNTWITGRNNNDLIIGPSGAGKTTGYVLPNILNSAESMIIVDTKGNLYHKTADHLRQKGYTVFLLDFTDIQNSPVGYNPLDFIHRDEMGEPNEQDIMTISQAILPDESVSNDPFWSRISRLVLETAVAYILDFTSDTTLTSVSTLLAELTTGKLDRLLEEVGAIAPDSLCYRRYAMWRNMRQAEKMTASVAGILAEAMAVLSSRGAQRLYADPVRVNFQSVANHKTAVFLNVSDTDAAQYKLVSLFYSQALHALSDYADRRPGNRLPIPVRLYLDDFASNLVIPEFDKIISVIRSREISVSIMLMDTERPVDGLYENRCPFVGLCGDHEMVTIWTFRAQIMTTPAGIIAIRAGFFYSRSARQALIMLFLGKLFYCYSVCYTFSTACHSPPNLVEKIENFTLINEQKKVGFQHC